LAVGAEFVAARTQNVDHVGIRVHGRDDFHALSGCRHRYARIGLKLNPRQPGLSTSAVATSGRSQPIARDVR
jgi:hypothetical protein